MSEYQPKTGAKCSCKRGVMRDNCANCEGTGWVIDFAAIRARRYKGECQGCAKAAVPVRFNSAKWKTLCQDCEHIAI